MHGGPLLLGREGAHDLRILVRGRACVAQEFHEPAERQGGDLPARPVPVHPAGQNRTEPDREDLGLDARPAAHDVMTVFMDRDDDRKRRDESRDGPDQIAE